MSNTSILQNVCIGWMLVFLTAGAAFAQSTAFTYQGRLSDNGVPANGNYEMRFRLFNQAANGFEFGTPKIIPNIAVTAGIFTVKLDVGDWTFDQNDRFMEIAVRPQGSANPFTALAPLQQITLAPKALFSDAAGIADHSMSSDFAVNSLRLGGLDSDRYSQKSVSGEIVAPRIENFATNPVPAVFGNTGRVYFNTTTNSLMVSNGTAWTSVSASRQIQTFTGELASGNFECIANTTLPVRTATFTKTSAATRLRITVRDVAKGTGPGIFYLSVNFRIDGSFISNPTNMTMKFISNHNRQAVPGSSPRVDNTFTAVGYANGIAAGTHIFTTTYSVQPIDVGGADPYICYRDPDAYLIEIEEIQ